MQFISPIDWDDAIDKIGNKTPIGSALTSEEWSQLPLALRERAFFSSQVESIRFLQNSRDFITDFLGNTRETLDDGRTVLKASGRQQFVKDMGEFAISHGLGPVDASDAGTIKDIRSEGRLNLIFDTMTQSANDYAYWKQGQNPDVLDEFPAQRFIRERDVKTPRDVHQLNTGVVRLKSDLDFWMAMNDPSFGGFGVPWGPWGFNSGMGVDDVDREEAEATGLIDADEKAKPVEKEFNDRLEASTRGLDDDMIALLKEKFGDQVEFDGDAVKWVGGKDEEESDAPETSAPKPAADSLEGILSDLGLDSDDDATLGDMRDLKAKLTEDNPLEERQMIRRITGDQPSGVLTEQNIRKVVQQFLNYLPPSVARRLPALDIKIVHSTEFRGEYSSGGIIKLSQSLLRGDEQQFRQTLFHEFMHWRHREGDQAYRDLIRAHFEERTQGERVVNIRPYAGVGKRDKWYDVYAGKIYSFETKPEGLEVPTRYIEWLTMPEDKMAEMWNNDDFRETMKIVLQGLF